MSFPALGDGLRHQNAAVRMLALEAVILMDQVPAGVRPAIEALFGDEHAGALPDPLRAPSSPARIPIRKPATRYVPEPLSPRRSGLLLTGRVRAAHLCPGRPVRSSSSLSRLPDFLMPLPGTPKA